MYFYWQQVQNDQLQNLYKNCDTGLKVEPEMGKAIIWYNHFLDPQNGWMGAMDNHTLHGGCPVTMGTKWVANFWIKATDDKLYDLKMMTKMKNKFVKTEKVNKKDLHTDETKKMNRDESREEL